MPDELPGEETGAVETPQQDVDWQKRYTDTHAEFNRLNERFTRFEKDPNALIEFIQEKHPDLLAEDEEEDTTEYVEPDEDDQPLTRAEWKQWQAEQAQTARTTAAQTQFETDYTKFVGDRELSPQGDAFVRYAATKGDIKGPDDLKKTIDDWFTYEDSLRPAKAKPRVPHVPTSGQAATQVPNWDDMTPGEINRYMVERVQAESAQT